MIKKAKITSLPELQKRKKEIRLEAEVAKREFAHTIGTTKGNASNFLLKKVAMPAGGAVVGLIFLKRLLSANDSKTPVIKETRVVHEYPDGRPYKGRGKRRNRTKTLASLVTMSRFLLPIIQAVIGAMTTKKAKQAAKVAKRAAVRK